jgi:hypothetical protein
VRGKLWNIENYINFQNKTLVKPFCILHVTLMLFMLNFASPVRQVTGWLIALIYDSQAKTENAHNPR